MQTSRRTRPPGAEMRDVRSVVTLCAREGAGRRVSCCCGFGGAGRGRGSQAVSGGCSFHGLLIDGVPKFEPTQHNEVKRPNPMPRTNKTPYGIAAVHWQPFVGTAISGTALHHFDRHPLR
jgi:hypothetical protein